MNQKEFTSQTLDILYGKDVVFEHFGFKVLVEGKETTFESLLFAQNRNNHMIGINYVVAPKRVDLGPRRPIVPFFLKGKETFTEVGYGYIPRGLMAATNISTTGFASVVKKTTNMMLNGDVEQDKITLVNHILEGLLKKGEVNFKLIISLKENCGIEIDSQFNSISHKGDKVYIRDFHGEYIFRLAGDGKIEVFPHGRIGSYITYKNLSLNPKQGKTKGLKKRFISLHKKGDKIKGMDSIDSLEILLNSKGIKI